MSGETRQMKLEKEREIMLEEIKRQKDALEREASRDRTGANRFTSQKGGVEEALKVETIGLVRLEEFREKRKELEDRAARERARTTELSKDEEVRRKKAKRDKKKATLSFAMEEEGGDAEGSATPEPPPAKRAKLGKNPNVDTTFLPDREREEQERKQREELRQKWLVEQEEAKKQVLEIVFSYYDGHAHRSETKVRQGDTIGQFLERARAQFPELSRTGLDNLLYIKEDLIIPHHFTFYEFIINKTRGKTGPLFRFDDQEDVRLLSDVRREVDESHAGKVVERNWYNRNQHIFPASRWEVFDPEKQYSENGYRWRS